MLLRLCRTIGWGAVVFIGCDDSDPASPTTTTTTTTDATIATDSATDASETSAPDVDEIGCEPMGGLYLLESLCRPPTENDQHFLCVRQSGCDIAFETAYPQSYATGTVLAESWSADDAKLECDGLVIDDSIDAVCHHEELSRCDLRGTRFELEGFSKVCCDVIANDCPSGERCRLIEIEGFTGDVPVCRPTTATVPLGGACTRTFDANDEVVDSCAPGGSCWRTDLSQPAGICRAVCRTQDACAEGELCRIADGYTPNGTCVPGCDPFDATSCAADELCQPIGAFGPGVSYGFAPTCLKRLGDRPLGEACDGSREQPCGAGLACPPPFPWTGPYVCAAPCNLENRCDDGFMCFRGAYGTDNTWPGMNDYGFCRPDD